MKSHAAVCGLSFAFCFCNLLARVCKVRPLCSRGSAFGPDQVHWVSVGTIQCCFLLIASESHISVSNLPQRFLGASKPCESCMDQSSRWLRWPQSEQHCRALFPYQFGVQTYPICFRFSACPPINFRISQSGHQCSYSWVKKNFMLPITQYLGRIFMQKQIHQPSNENLTWT
jgi:hypothetical protein